jgi:hypothetical protein
VEVKKQYQVQFSNRFATFEKLDDDVDINKACKRNRKNTRTSATEARLLLL